MGSRVRSIRADEDTWAQVEALAGPRGVNAFVVEAVKARLSDGGPKVTRLTGGEGATDMPPRNTATHVPSPARLGDVRSPSIQKPSKTPVAAPSEIPGVVRGSEIEAPCRTTEHMRAKARHGRCPDCGEKAT